MPYTLWSRDHLLGESDFELTSEHGRRRAGTFRPTVLGATLLPTLCGMGPAVLLLEAMLTRERLTPERVARAPAGDLQAILSTSPEGRKVMSIAQRLIDLQLVVRDPEGAIMATESIAVNDLERLRSAARTEDSPVAPPSDDGSRVDRPRYIMSATVRRLRDRLVPLAIPRRLH